MRGRRWILPILLVAGFLGLWELAAHLGWLNPSLMSSPSRIADALWKTHVRRLPERSILLTHIGVSLQRVFLAGMIGTGSGVLIGILMGTSRVVYRLFDPIVTLLMPIPGIAQAPLFIVWLGFGDPTIITVGAIASFFPIAFNTAAGVRSVDGQLVRAARLMGVSPAGCLPRVYLPSAAGHIMAGVKLGWARCWRTVIAVEFVAAASWGLGYMIWDASEYIRSGVVFGGILLLMLVYFAMERVVLEGVERLTVRRWGMIQS